MRHILLISIYFLTLPAFGQSQRMHVLEIPRQERPNQQLEKNRQVQKEGRLADRIKRVKDIKVAFITRQLDLNSAQSDKFWPLYNQYQTELIGLQIQKRKNNSTSATNGIDQLDKESLLDQKILDTKLHYKNEFLKILPPEKVSQIYKSEKLFIDEAIKHRSEMKNEAGD